MYYLFVILFSVGWILISIVRNYISKNSPISHKYLNHGKQIVPTRKYSKLKFNPLILRGGLLTLTIRDAGPLGFAGWRTTLPFFITSLKFSSSSCLLAFSFNPWFITGFSDGEGCFSCNVTKNPNFKAGYKVGLVFSIILHVKDKDLLENFKNFFPKAEGSIYTHGPQSIQLRVFSVKDLPVLINHFDQFPLITQKRADYELWKQVFYLIQNKEHLTKEGINKILAIRATMNRGLSDTQLKEALPSTVKPAERPQYLGHNIPDPHWLAGLSSGECSFMVKIKASKTITGFAVHLEFQLTQHNRDLNLMSSLIKFLDCGNIYPDREFIIFRVSKFQDITQKIIPFFTQYLIQGVKTNDFNDWCKVAKLMTNKQHLTKEGLAEIKKIKSRMNTGRLINLSAKIKKAGLDKNNPTQTDNDDSAKPATYGKPSLGNDGCAVTKLKKNAKGPSGNPLDISEKCSAEGFKFIGRFVSARRAANLLEISERTIIKYMNSGSIYKNRYKFSSRPPTN